MAHQPGAVAGVGQMIFTPNSRNVLPGKVVFTIDLRTPSQAKLDSSGMKLRPDRPTLPISRSSSRAARGR